VAICAEEDTTPAGKKLSDKENTKSSPV